MLTDKNGKVFEDTIKAVVDGGVLGNNDVDVFFWQDDWQSFKLLAKDPTEMPDEERAQYKEFCKKITDTNKKIVYICDTPASLHFGISRGYDMFELTENNQIEIYYEK